VLPPIETKELSNADVDDLAQSTRELMLKTLAELSGQNEQEVDGTALRGSSTAVEI
jgi:lysophosphatidate acyltransferase